MNQRIFIKIADNRFIPARNADGSIFIVDANDVDTLLGKLKELSNVYKVEDIFVYNDDVGLTLKYV